MAPMSLKPSEVVESQGGIPTGELTVVRAYFGLWTRAAYDGQNANSPAQVSMTAYLDLQNSMGEVRDQRYSVGNPENFTILNDGKVLDGKLNSKCNFVILLRQLIDLGYPEDRLDTDISVALEGLSGHWEMGTGKSDGPMAENLQSAKLVLPREIHRYPWDGASGGNQATVQTSNGTSNADIPSMAINMVKELINSGEDPTRQQLTLNTFHLEVSETVKTSLMEYIFTPDLATAVEAEGIHLEGERFVR